MSTEQLAEDAARQVWVDAADCARRWQGGEDRALDDLVRLLSPVLWQVVRAYDLDRDLAEDVVQTTWLRLVHHRDRVRDVQAVGAWLTTTARREAARVAKRSRRDLLTEDVHVAAGPSVAPSAERLAVARDDAERLWAGVLQLPDRCRRLLRVIAFSDRPQYADLADELGMPVGSIGPTRRRCLDKLRAIVGAPEPGASS